MKKLLIPAAMLASVSSAAAGENTTGNFCAATMANTQDAGYCYGEVVGTVEAGVYYGRIALPPGVNDIQILAMVRKFMDRHPELLNRSIHELALRAMTEAGWGH